MDGTEVETVPADVPGKTQDIGMLPQPAPPHVPHPEGQQRMPSSSAMPVIPCTPQVSSTASVVVRERGSGGAGERGKEVTSWGREGGGR